MTDIYVTTTQAGNALGVSSVTIARWLDTGKLRGYKTKGGHRRVLREDVERMRDGGSDD